MLSSLIVCVLVVGAVALKPGKPFGAMYGAHVPSEEPHEPCCAPRYFTFSQTDTITSVGFTGGLLVELINSDGAYDAIAERVSVRIFEDFFNRTERHLRFIAKYKEEVSYFIVKNGDEEFCYVGETEGKFPEECLPRDATFVGEATLGDYDLRLDNWYYPSADFTEHTVKSVQHEGCVPVSLFVRTFDSTTGEEVSVSKSAAYNFNLGICNPDEYFKPPPSCDEGRALAEPTPEMLKFRRRKGLFL